MMENFNVNKMIEKYEYEPEFLNFFGETEDAINICKLYIEERIWKLSS